MFGWLDRFSATKRKEDKARKRELVGDLDAAIELFLAAERPEEAARVLLLQADACRDVTARLKLCAQAARVGQGHDVGEEAARRKALLGFDVVKSGAGVTMASELVRIAKELEAVGEWEAAAEAYVMAGDTEAEIRVLEEAGAIERLEERLRETSEVARRERDRAALIRRLRDLDAIAERRPALREARVWLERGYDEQIELEADRIRARLVRGPRLNLVVDGTPDRYVLGSELSIGRAHADILVASTSISRQHLRLFRRDGEVVVEDLQTRNGTLLRGARVGAALPVGEGLELSLAGVVPCRITPIDPPRGPVRIEVGGERYVVPLGPLVIGAWTLTDAHDGDDRFVVLRTPEGATAPYRGDYLLGPEIQLCVGDELRRVRGGPVVLEVPAGKR